MCEGGPPALSIGRLVELWRVVRMCPFHVPPPAVAGRAHARMLNFWLLEIRIGNRANNASWVAGRDRVGGDILRDDGASANDDAVS